MAIDNTFTCYTSQEIEILTGGELPLPSGMFLTKPISSICSLYLRWAH